MARKFTTQPPRDLSSNEQNNDEEDDSEDDNEEHNVVFSTCLTWEHSMQVAMAEVAKLGHIKKKCRGISDTEIRIPRNSDAAYYQFEGYSQFKQVAERTLQEYREALDDIRYTRDGTMRKELELEDRSEYYDCVKECEEYNDCYEYDPPMIRPVSCNSYFQELVR